jgi:hypothetical protein
VRLRIQPAAQHGRRQVLTPQFGGRRRGTVCARCAPWQRRRWPGSRAIRAVCGITSVYGLSALGRVPRADVPWARDTVPHACGTAVGGDCRAAASHVNLPDGVPRARLAARIPVTCSALLLGVAPPLSLVTLEFARDRGEYALPQVFGNDPKVDSRRGPGRAGRTRNAAGKRRNAAVIYHAATPRRPAHERDVCLDSGTYIARLIQPKSHIVSRKLLKVHTPMGA